MTTAWHRPNKAVGRLAVHTSYARFRNDATHAGSNSNFTLFIICITVLGATLKHFKNRTTQLVCLLCTLFSKKRPRKLFQKLHGLGKTVLLGRKKLFRRLQDENVDSRPLTSAARTVKCVHLHAVWLAPAACISVILKTQNAWPYIQNSPFRKAAENDSYVEWNNIGSVDG